MRLRPARRRSCSGRAVHSAHHGLPLPSISTAPGWSQMTQRIWFSFSFWASVTTLLGARLDRRSWGTAPPTVPGTAEAGAVFRPAASPRRTRSGTCRSACRPELRACRDTASGSSRPRSRRLAPHERVEVRHRHAVLLADWTRLEVIAHREQRAAGRADDRMEDRTVAAEVADVVLAGHVAREAELGLGHEAPHSPARIIASVSAQRMCAGISRPWTNHSSSSREEMRRPLSIMRWRPSSVVTWRKAAHVARKSALHSGDPGVGR